MKRSIFLVAVSIAANVAAGAESRYELMMSLNDRFVVSPPEKWNVEIQKYLQLRFANVKITPKTGAHFDLMLYFKCDTPDLSQFDTPKKMERSVKTSSEKYLSGSVEKSITLKELNIKGWYGFYTVLTDATQANQQRVAEGEFKYITRGMVRLSPDSALGFSLITNELGTPRYQALLDYVAGFVKAKK